MATASVRTLLMCLEVKNDQQKSLRLKSLSRAICAMGRIAIFCFAGVSFQNPSKKFGTAQWRNNFENGTSQSLGLFFVSSLRLIMVSFRVQIFMI